MEVVKVTFDPSIITYHRLVEHFFEIHDPTTRDRQGPDTGKQYRSVIFFTSDGQRKEAEDVRRRLDGSGHLDAPVVTDISPAGPFYRAEEYHQHYYSRNGFPGCVL